MSVRRRQLVPVGIVLVLTVVGFFVARALGELDARRDSTHRAEIAATRVRDRVAQAATLVDGLRRYLSGPASSGVTTEQFTDIGALWLSPVGLPAAAWVEPVSAHERVSYERRTGHHIVAPTFAGGLARVGLRKSYLPATLVTGLPPMSAPGIDLGGPSGIAAAVARPQTAYAVSATSFRRLPDGTSGLFLVQSAQSLNRGVVEPGFAVLFLPASWLLAAATDAPDSAAAANPRMQIAVGGVLAGNLGGAAPARSMFTAAGQRFTVSVPRGAVHGAAEVLPWFVLGGGLLLAALAGALEVNAVRRVRTKAEVDRLFTLSPDLIVVAGFDGYFKRVNPAFEAQLGYTQQEALSRPYVEFVHPDDRGRTLSEASRLSEGETTIAFENRYVCKDGSFRWIEWTATPVLEERLIYAVARDVTERRQAETEFARLAEEQGGLRRVATLVARRTRPEEVFAAVVEEVGRLLSVDLASMGRYDSVNSLIIVASWGTGGDYFPVGSRRILGGDNLGTIVSETGRPARMDNYGDSSSGEIADAARGAGVRSSVGSPIVVESRLWGVITASSTLMQRLPPDAEARLAEFTELAATAISNAESRAAVARLADEQAALRRVATLVAEGVEPGQVFSALCEEVVQLLDAQTSTILRLEADGTVTAVANGGMSADEFAVGTRTRPAPGMVIIPVLETGRPARREDSDETAIGIRSTVAVPIVVGGKLWGVFWTGTVREHFADDTEQRLEEFTELAATAIANADNRAELAASRVRIVAASDETRRRIERDLHDGTQQRLVSLSLELRVAESSVPAELEEPRRTLGRVASELNGVIDELREISRGIHPAILSEGGLGPALRTLARRSAIPVELGSVIDRRLPEHIEVAAYYVVSEALTNATKHANATRVGIEAVLRDSSLRLSIRDEGVGGADPARGSGLVGLRDRVEALGGSIEISSPPGRGTHVAVQLPLELDLTVDESEKPGRTEFRQVAN